MSTAVRRALYGRMSGDTTLTGMLGTAPSGYSQSIYHGEAPDTANYPFVIFSKSSGTPTESMSVPVALQNDVWLIKAVDRSASADIAESIADRLKVLLNDGALSIAGGAKLAYLRHNSDIEYRELIEGVVYPHVGALFRLVYQP